MSLPMVKSVEQKPEYENADKLKEIEHPNNLIISTNLYVL